MGPLGSNNRDILKSILETQIEILNVLRGKEFVKNIQTNIEEFKIDQGEISGWGSNIIAMDDKKINEILDKLKDG